MEIYVLIDEEDPDYRNIIYVSENIKDVYFYFITMEECMKDFITLEMWWNGNCIAEYDKKDDILTKIVSIINEQGGIKEYEKHDTENQ